MSMLEFAESVQKKHDELEKQGRLGWQNKLPIDYFTPKSVMHLFGIKIFYHEIRKFNRTVKTK